MGNDDVLPKGGKWEGRVIYEQISLRGQVGYTFE